MGKFYYATVRERVPTQERADEEGLQYLEKRLDPESHLDGTVQDLLNYLLSSETDSLNPEPYDTTQEHVGAVIRDILEKPSFEYSIFALERSSDGLVEEEDLSKRVIDLEGTVGEYMERFGNTRSFTLGSDNSVEARGLDIYLYENMIGGNVD
ncbi:hypothetical protein CMO92_02635 [Candidatus Woesearchaeota archaeon]|nr:hypothetical protein [Candidatus Woesearchaeota archaeon]|tara:strand:- start:4126 stop:4584 length:459 start_codon:yes stop_codon:yes gene_type:complete